MSIKNDPDKAVAAQELAQKKSWRPLIATIALSAILAIGIAFTLYHFRQAWISKKIFMPITLSGAGLMGIALITLNCCLARARCARLDVNQEPTILPRPAAELEENPQAPLEDAAILPMPAAELAEDAPLAARQEEAQLVNQDREPMPAAELQEEAQPIHLEPAPAAELAENPEAILIHCGETINWFTGTNSTTLFGAQNHFKRFGLCALVPTGELLAKGMVPLTGELLGGIIENFDGKGVNQIALSGVDWKNVGRAWGYATTNFWQYDPQTELKYLGNFKNLCRIEISLKRLALYPPPDLNREQVAQDLHDRLGNTWLEPAPDWRNYLGWVGKEAVGIETTREVVHPLHPGQLVVVKRSSGKNCYGVIQIRYADDSYHVAVETDRHRFYSPNDILLPKALPPLSQNPQLEANIAKTVERRLGFTRMIQEFKETEPMQYSHPFVTAPFPIVIGAHIPAARQQSVRSDIKGEFGARGAVSFQNDVKVIFAPDENQRQVKQWLSELQLNIPVLSADQISTK